MNVFALYGKRKFKKVLKLVSAANLFKVFVYKHISEWQWYFVKPKRRFWFKKMRFTNTLKQAKQTFHSASSNDYVSKVYSLEDYVMLLVFFLIHCQFQNYIVPCFGHFL